jgi:hypothetical protein
VRDQSIFCQHASARGTTLSPRLLKSFADKTGRNPEGVAFH